MFDGPPSAAPYTLAVESRAQGPMSDGMGLLEIVAFDPALGRPFVIMRPGATLALGTC